MAEHPHMLGGHVSIAGGFAKAPERAALLGGNALQMFSGSPRGWNLPKVTSADAEAFKNAAQKYGIVAAYFHASYLVNLADDGFIGDRSVDALIAELAVAEMLGVRGSIVHLGSFKEGHAKSAPTRSSQSLFALRQHESAHTNERHPKYGLLIQNIKTVLKESPERTLFIIEGMGTRKIGKSLEEIGNIVSDVNNQRLKVCLDTCHLHAAGYDLSTPKKLDDFLDTFDTTIGLRRLECFHINDSRDEFGSLRDRHDNLGEGKIPKDVFKLLLHHPKTKHLPFLLEVPGFDDGGPDKKNMDILKTFLK
jgi:deoxyribonuclease-4